MNLSGETRRRRLTYRKELSAGSLQIETFEGRRLCLRRTWQAMGVQSSGIAQGGPFSIAGIGAREKRWGLETERGTAERAMKRYFPAVLTVDDIGTHIGWACRSKPMDHSMNCVLRRVARALPPSKSPADLLSGELFNQDHRASAVWA